MMMWIEAAIVALTAAAVANAIAGRRDTDGSPCAKILRQAHKREGAHSGSLDHGQGPRRRGHRIRRELIEELEEESR